MNDQDYYNDFEQRGNYQYVLLEQVINDMMANMDEDSYISNMERHKILYHAKRGIRELYYDVMQEIKAIEIEISTTLKIILPPDYVNYVRISWVDERGQLHPLAEDNRQSIARAYLQDNKYDLLFDNEGCVLEGSGIRDTVDKEDTRLSNLNSFLFSHEYHSTFTPNIDRSRIYENGKFRINKRDGAIEFSSDIFTRNIVLEYISDGLYISDCEGAEDEIKVHKFAEQALIDFIKYRVVDAKRNAPAVEKQWSRKQYFRSARLAKSRILTFRLDNILQASKGDSVWVKGLYS